MIALARIATAVGAAVGITMAGTAVGTPAPAALGPEPVTVVVDVEHSTFKPSSLRVVTGTRVRFVVVNNDPINHEFIVGPPGVHERHSDGTEEEHPPVDGEVSVGPLGRGVTAYTFSDVGTTTFACHLPGHLAYGMRGVVDVVAEQRS